MTPLSTPETAVAGPERVTVVASLPTVKPCESLEGFVAGSPANAALSEYGPGTTLRGIWAVARPSAPVVANLAAPPSVNWTTLPSSGPGPVSVAPTVATSP